MNSKLCVIALIAATAFAAPVAAQDGRAGIWAPWTVDEVQSVPQTQLAVPAPRVQRVQVAQTVTPAAPEQDTVVERLFRMDRFWVIGSFR